jgi:hypothetical protein
VHESRSLDDLDEIVAGLLSPACGAGIRADRTRAVVADRTSRAYRPPVEIAQSRNRLSFVRYREVLSGNIAIGGLSNTVYLIGRGAVIDLSVIGLT